jgi:uncharacterized protein (TIGR02466 family)
MSNNKPNIQQQLLDSVIKPSLPKQSVLEVEHHFSSPVYYINKPEFLDTTRAACEDFLAESHKTTELNDIYPVMMTGNMYSDPRVSELTQFIAQAAWEILHSQGYDMATLSTYFTEFWCQEHHKHSLMEQHVHGNGAQIVGFYFVDSPEGSSMVQYHDPKAGKVQSNLPELNAAQVSHASNAVLYRATPGTVMFAPAWLSHSFTRHSSDQPMRFIHFNINVTPAANLASSAMPEASACPAPTATII